jgi:hypothetical protein
VVAAGEGFSGYLGADLSGSSEDGDFHSG